MSQAGDNPVSGRRGAQDPGESVQLLKVAWVASRGTFPQLGRILAPLAVGLSDELIELTGLCGPDACEGAFEEWPMEVKRISRPHWYRSGKAVRRVADDLRERDVALLHALDAGAGEVTAILARELNCPHVVSSYCLGDGRLVGRMCVRPGIVLAAGQAVRDDLIERHCIQDDRVMVIRPAACEVSHTGSFSNPHRSAAIVTSDRFEDYGAMAAVLDAFARLHAAGVECAFFAIGNGPVERQLRKHAEDLGLCDSLTFADALDASQLAGILKAADVYISPRATNSVNVDALLAMSVGTAVLAPQDHVSDFLIDGQTAAIFRPRDAQALADRLSEMLEDPGETTALAGRALEYLRTNHDPAHTLTAIADCYRKAVSLSDHHVQLSA